MLPAIGEHGLAVPMQGNQAGGEAAAAGARAGGKRAEPADATGGSKGTNLAKQMQLGDPAMPDPSRLVLKEGLLR